MKASQTKELRQKAEGEQKDRWMMNWGEGEKMMRRKKSRVIGSCLTWFVSPWTIKKPFHADRNGRNLTVTSWEGTEVKSFSFPEEQDGISRVVKVPLADQLFMCELTGPCMSAADSKWVPSHINDLKWNHEAVRWWYEFRRSRCQSRGACRAAAGGMRLAARGCRQNRGWRQRGWEKSHHSITAHSPQAGFLWLLLERCSHALGHIEFFICFHFLVPAEPLCSWN